MSDPADYTFQLSDPRDASDEEIAEGVELSNGLVEEFFPEEPRATVAVAIAATRATPARFGLWRVRVRDADGLLVAGVTIHKDWDNDTNPDVGGIGVSVRAGHRGKGIGTALLAWQVAFAQALGQSRLLLNTDSRMPAGDQVAAALGAQVKMREHENRLRLSQVNRSLMDDWRQRANDEDYELLAFDNVVPEELAQAYVDLVLVMNTAPREDLEVNDFTYSVAELREGELRREKVGARDWHLVVRHRPTGQLVGLHTLYFSPEDPKKAYVGVTGVRPEHRGHGLGRLLKATLTLRLLAQRPAIEHVVTGNADSNAAMLTINEQMGYRPHASAAVWEVSRVEVERLLADRGTDIPSARAAEAVSAQRARQLASV